MLANFMSQICQKCGSEKVEGWEHGSLCDGCYVQESNCLTISSMQILPILTEEGKNKRYREAIMEQCPYYAV